jgi:outer membrane protein assembly factor BamB
MPKFVFSGFFVIIALLLQGCSHLPEVTGVSPKQMNRFNYAIRWAYNHDPISDTGNTPISFLSPAIQDGKVFIGSLAGTFHSYDLVNGKELWKMTEKSSVSNAAAFYKDQVLYGTAEGRVVARKMSNGELVYAVDVSLEAVESTVVVARGRGLVQTRDHKLVCFDILTGKILWNYSRAVAFDTTLQRVSTPTTLDEKVYVGFADGFVVSFNIEDGSIFWEKNISRGSKFVDVDMKPLLYQNKILIASHSGNFMVLEAASGKTLVQTPYLIYRSPILIGDILYLGTQDGKLVKLDAQSMQELASIDLKEPIFSIASWGEHDEHIAVPTIKGNVYFVNSDNLKVVSKLALGTKNSIVYGEMAVLGTRLSVSTSRNRIYLLEAI